MNITYNFAFNSFAKTAKGITSVTFLGYDYDAPLHYGKLFRQSALLFVVISTLLVLAIATHNISLHFITQLITFL